MFAGLPKPRMTLTDLTLREYFLRPPDSKRTSETSRNGVLELYPTPITEQPAERVSGTCEGGRRLFRRGHRVVELKNVFRSLR